VIAVNAPAAVLQFMLARLMETEGLSIDDVQTISMAWPNMGPGLETKALDGGMVVEPFAALYAQKNIAFPFRRAADFMKKPPLDAIIADLAPPIQRSPPTTRSISSRGGNTGLALVGLPLLFSYAWLAS